MIRLNCFFKAETPEAYSRALEAAKKLTEKSLGHEGCVAYDVFASATRPDVFVIVETWKDQAALDRHSATPEFAEYVGVMEQCGQLKLEKFDF